MRWIFNVKDPGSRLMHWRLKLGEYDFEVVHEADKLDTNADALSRMYVITRAQQRELTASNVAEQESAGEDKIDPSTEEIPVILKGNQRAPFTGHPGSQRLYQKLKMEYYWEDMGGDVEDYVAV
uniref:Integrase zinc-binding domain-containing protein n=1 Tax=Bracon brevicornis TaxID=1563983 RepID=A0A6V7KS20_9HYME